MPGVRRRSRERLATEEGICKPIAVGARAATGHPDGAARAVVLHSDGTEPPPTFASTLADIFSDACLQDSSLQAKLEAPPPLPKLQKKEKLAERRPTGLAITVPFAASAVAAASAKVEEATALANMEEATLTETRRRTGPGNLRSAHPVHTDVRTYGTLEHLLSSDWQPPAPITPDHGQSEDLLDDSLPVVPSARRKMPPLGRPCTEGGNTTRRGSADITTRQGSAEAGSLRRKSAEDGHFKRGSVEFKRSSIGLGVAARKSEAARTLSGRQHHRSSIKLHSGAKTQRESRRRSVLGARTVGFMTPTSSFGSSSDSESDSSKSDGAKELLAELQTNSLSQDWGMILGFARDVANKRASAEVPHIFADFQEEPSAAIAEPTISSWRVNAGPRPRSPLRPGVYVGYDAPEHSKLSVSSRRRDKLPPGLPDRAAASFNSGRFPQISPPSRPVTSDAIASARRNRQAAEPGKTGPGGVPQPAGQPQSNKQPPQKSVWQKMLAELEDAGKTEESRAYDAWRKRVVDCTRTMQLEVTRFKLDEGS